MTARREDALGKANALKEAKDRRKFAIVISLLLAGLVCGYALLLVATMLDAKTPPIPPPFSTAAPPISSK